MSKVLFHIGYPKTGTSWMQKHLFSKRHSYFNVLSKNDYGPSTLGTCFIRNVRDKMLYPLDMNDAEIKKEILNYNLNLGITSVVSHEGLSGGFNRGAINVQSIAKRISFHFPNALILIVLREQQQMLFSNYFQNLVAGRTTSIKRYLGVGCHIEAIDYSHLEYEHIIRFYRSLFGVNRVKILPYELFLHSPKEFISQIGLFTETQLRLSDFSFKDNINQTKDVYFRHHLRVINYLPFIDKRVKQILYKKVSCLMSRLITLKISRRLDLMKEKQLKNIIDLKVGNRYQESNKKLSELIGIDLSKYGYHD